METETVVTPPPGKKLGIVARIPKRAAAVPAPKPAATKKTAPRRVAAEADAPPPAKAKKAKTSDGAVRGVRGMAGATTGLGIAAFQNQLMQKNYKAKLTDAELAEAMRREFPSAIAYTEKHVAGIRSAFNMGHHGNERPEEPLPRFGDDRKPITRGARAEKTAPAPKAEKAPKAKVKVSKKKG
jgi:hypothetical protein